MTRAGRRCHRRVRGRRRGSLGLLRAPRILAGGVPNGDPRRPCSRSPSCSARGDGREICRSCSRRRRRRGSGRTPEPGGRPTASTPRAIHHEESESGPGSTPNPPHRRRSAIPTSRPWPCRDAGGCGTKRSYGWAGSVVSTVSRAVGQMSSTAHRVTLAVPRDAQLCAVRGPRQAAGRPTPVTSRWSLPEHVSVHPA